MPWRSRPRAASAASLLWICGLALMVGLLCVRLLLGLPGESAETLSCVSVRGDRWNLLPGVEYTGRIKVDLPEGRDARLTLVIGDAMPLTIEGELADGMPVPLGAEPIDPHTAPVDFWLEYGSPLSAPAHIVKAVLGARADRAQTIVVNLGRRAPRVLARLVGYSDAARARICAAPVGASPAFATATKLEIVPAHSPYFASGWYGLDTSSSLGPVRWMSDYGVLLVPASRDGSVRVRLQAVPASGEGELTFIALKVNDVFEATPIAMSSTPSAYEWVIPATAWVAGTNELLLTVSSTVRSTSQHTDGRSLGLALQKITLTLIEDQETTR